jgi:hypothetical protein
LDIIKIITLLLFLFYYGIHAQQKDADSLNIRYEIISQSFSPDKNVIKIRIPPYLYTEEVMEQIRMVLQWPGDPPPKKVTHVYIFRETDQIGDTSQTGAIYIPGKGFKWRLGNWKPVEFPLKEPSIREKIIYNTFLDTLFVRGSTMHNIEIKEKIAKQFNISVSKLDSIYFKVKYWMFY